MFIEGCTTFYAASPYLVFLMIKRALVRFPSYAPKEMNDFMRLLLEKNGLKRLENVLSGGLGGDKIDNSKGICYDNLRNHDFFKLGSR